MLTTLGGSGCNLEGVSGACILSMVNETLFACMQRNEAVVSNMHAGIILDGYFKLETSKLEDAQLGSESRHLALIWTVAVIALASGFRRRIQRRVCHLLTCAQACLLCHVCSKYLFGAYIGAKHLSATKQP